jgi:hypothetical protein
MSAEKATASEFLDIVQGVFGHFHGEDFVSKEVRIKGNVARIHMEVGNPCSIISLALKTAMISNVEGT